MPAVNRGCTTGIKILMKGHEILLKPKGGMAIGKLS
jgi:hypothetical protein